MRSRGCASVTRSTSKASASAIASASSGRSPASTTARTRSASAPSSSRTTATSLTGGCWIVRTCSPPSARHACTRCPSASSISRAWTPPRRSIATRTGAPVPATRPRSRLGRIAASTASISGPATPSSSSSSRSVRPLPSALCWKIWSCRPSKMRTASPPQARSGGSAWLPSGPLVPSSSPTPDPIAATFGVPRPSTELPSRHTNTYAFTSASRVSSSTVRLRTLRSCGSSGRCRGARSSPWTRRLTRRLAGACARGEAVSVASLATRRPFPPLAGPAGLRRFPSLRTQAPLSDRRAHGQVSPVFHSLAARS